MGDPGWRVGTFAWRELVTDDPAGAAPFYGELFRWTWTREEGAAGACLVASRDGARVAGIVQRPGGAPLPSSWRSHVLVDDVDAAVERCRAEGGRVLERPRDVSGAGRLALVADPLGAVLVPFRAAGERAPSPRGPGRFSWETLVTHDPEGARDYYREVIGFGATATPGGHAILLTAGEVPVADVQFALPGGPSYWATYVEVEDAEASSEVAVRLGGSVVVPRFEVPKLGMVAVVADPEGATLGLFEPAPRRPQTSL